MGIFDTDFQKIKNEYLHNLKDVSGQYDAVYIYGAGRVANLLCRLLSGAHIEMNGFCVTDVKNNPSTILGIPVVQIDELNADKDKTLFIIGTMRQKSGGIIRTLEAEGYMHYVEAPENINYFNDRKLEIRNRPILEVTPKIGCHIHCRYCPQDLLYKEYFADEDRKSVMELELYKKCIDKTPMDCVIVFAGFVEPFLHPDAVEMIRYAADTGRDVSLYTTLVGVTTEKWEAIKDISFYEFVLHTADDEGYANIPLTEDYFRILDEVLDTDRPDGQPFVDYANCQGSPHREVLKHTNGKILITNELIDRAGNITDEEVYEDSHKKGNIVCERARDLNHSILLPDGSVVLCCMDFGMKHVLGNLAKQSYEELFTGKEMQKIKEAMKDDRLDIICRRCSSAIETQAPD